MLRSAALGLIAASALTSVEGFAGAPSALPLANNNARAAQCSAPTMSLEGGGPGVQLSRRAILLGALLGGPAAANAGPFDAVNSAARRAKIKKGEYTPPPEEDSGVNPLVPAETEAKKPAAKSGSPVKDLLKQGADKAKQEKADKEASKAAKKAEKAEKAEKKAPKEAPKVEKKAPKSDFTPPPRKEGKRLEPDTKALLRKEKEERAKAAAKADAAAKNPALKPPKADTEGDVAPAPERDYAPKNKNLFGEPGRKEKPKKEKKEKKEKEGGGGLGLGGKPKASPSSTGFEGKGIDSLESKLEKRRKAQEAAKEAAGAAAE